MKKKIQKLKINPNFTPCKKEPLDELYRNGIFEFNISKILNDIKSNAICFEIIDLDVKLWQKYHNLSANLNEEHIQSVDVTIPIIIAEISPQNYNCIDGNHRLEKANRNNIKNIKAYKISSPQHINYLTYVSAYKKYIDYWNSKLADNNSI